MCMYVFTCPYVYITYVGTYTKKVWLHSHQTAHGGYFWEMKLGWGETFTFYFINFYTI